MENGSKRSVSFECRTAGEAELILRAVRAYRLVLQGRGDDPRNYAPATAEGAGFGWDAIDRAAMDMGKGTVTHMSRRMAEALRDAVQAYRTETVNRDDRVHIVNVLLRLNTPLISDGGE